MKQKYIIVPLAALETLTLFPLLFWGIFHILNSTNISQINTTSMLTAIAVAIIYAGAVLFGAYKAVHNIPNPVRAYLFLLIPPLISILTYFWWT